MQLTQEEIKSFLEGNDPEKYIVAVEYDYQSSSIYKIIEDPEKGKLIKKDRFTPFCWVGDLRSKNFYGGSKERQKQAISKYGIIIDKLETHENERLSNGLTFIVKTTKSYQSLVRFFREGGLDPWQQDNRDSIIILSPFTGAVENPPWGL